MFTSAEKYQTQIIEKQKTEGVTGDYKRRYTFSLSQQHWIAPSYSIKNQVGGSFDCGLKGIAADGTQRWSIELWELDFDWNPHAVPETYYLFAYPSRMDIHISKDGKLTGGSTQVNYQEQWNRKYRPEVAARINDSERADNLLRALGGSKNNDKLALSLLEANPLVTALCNMVKLNYHVKYTKEPAGEFGERFTGEITKPDYFSDQIDLPLKTTWIKRALKEDNQEEWTHLGGLVKEKYPEYELRKLLQTITGKQLPDMNLHVRFAELYRVDRHATGFLQIGYGLLQTETHIQDTWLKTEELELRTDEKGITYGAE